MLNAEFPQVMSAGFGGVAKVMDTNTVTPI